MTKAAFIDSVDELYDMRNRVAKNAKCIIEDMLREKGDMDDEYLYGDDDDHLWLGEDKYLNSVKASKYGTTIVLENRYGDEYNRFLCDMSPEDVVEIADYLCRM